MGEFPIEREWKRHIRCPKIHPFTTWQVGDLIEVDNDETKYSLSCFKIYENEVRMKIKIALSDAMSASLVPYTASSSVLSLASEELTRGKDNFECRIENRSGGYEKIIYNRGNWRYEKTSFGN